MIITPTTAAIAIPIFAPVDNLGRTSTSRGGEFDVGVAAVELGRDVEGAVLFKARDDVDVVVDNRPSREASEDSYATAT